MNDEMKKALAALSKVPMEELMTLFTGPIQEVMSLKEKLNSPDPVVREMAIKKAVELKEQMKEQISELYRKNGVDFSKLISSIHKTAEEGQKG